MGLLPPDQGYTDIFEGLAGHEQAKEVLEEASIFTVSHYFGTVNATTKTRKLRLPVKAELVAIEAVCGAAAAESDISVEVDGTAVATVATSGAAGAGAGDSNVLHMQSHEFRAPGATAQLRTIEATLTAQDGTVITAGTEMEVIADGTGNTSDMACTLFFKRLCDSPEYQHLR